MDYRRLSREADVMGSAFLESKAGMIGMRIEEARSKENSSGNVPKGLKRARRAVKFQLGRALRENSINPLDSVDRKVPKNVSAPQVDAERMEVKTAIAKIALKRMPKLPDGIELMHPEVSETLQYTNEVGEKEDAFVIVSGMNPKTGEQEFYAIAANERFRDCLVARNLQPHYSFNGIKFSCKADIQRIEDDQVTRSLENVREARRIFYQNGNGQDAVAYIIYEGQDEYSDPGESTFIVRGIGDFACTEEHRLWGFALENLVVKCEDAVKAKLSA